MDFNELTFEELDQHAIEKLVFESDELSPILKGHIFVEKILETLISNNIPAPKSLFNKRRSFELKLDIARALELIDDKYYGAFKALNKLRNNYAHMHDYRVSIEELNSLKFDWEEIQNKAFDVAKSKGTQDAVQLAIIFLCWKAIWLLKSPSEIGEKIK